MHEPVHLLTRGYRALGVGHASIDPAPNILG